MEFDTRNDLDLYNNISESVIIVNNQNRIQWFNSSALDLCEISDIKIIEDLKLEEVIKFYNFEDKVFHPIDLQRDDVCVKVQAIMKTNKINEEIKLVIKKIIISGNQYNLLLIDTKKQNSIFRKNDQFNINDNYKVSDVLKLNCDETHSLKIVNAVFGATPTAIIIEKNNKIIYTNNSAKNIIGNENYVGSSLNEIIVIDKFNNDNAGISGLIKDEYNMAILERKLVKKDGKVIYCEICPMSFVNNDILYNVYLLKNTSDKVEAQSALKRNHDNYVTLLKSLPFGVAIYKDNQIELANEMHQKNFNYKNIDEMNEKYIWDAVHPDYLDYVRKMYYNAYSNNFLNDFKEVKVINSEGKSVEIEMAITVIDVNKTKSVVIMSRDVTERKKASLNKLKLEQALKYDKLKTEFICNMSHELKTPLNIILSTIHVMQYNYKDKNDMQLNKYMDLTKVNGYRLLRLINNLIDVTRIDVGNLKMNFGNYDIVRIVEDITMAAVEYVESRGMTLVFDTDVEEKVIGIDKVNIERIMLNLLSNAVKFSKENGSIKVELHDLGDKVQIKVRDNGIGIPEAMVDTIFDKFVQSEDLFTRSHEGSGVGLSLVRSIVENHGGSVYVNSIVDRGSEFIVELPNILSKNTEDNTNKYSTFKENEERIRIEFSDIYN